MNTVKGSITSSKPISLSKAASVLSSFVSVETGASAAVSAYLRRASASFNELVQFHRELKSEKSGRKRRKSHLEALDDGNLEGPSNERGRINDLGEHSFMARENFGGDHDDEGRNSEKKKKKKKKKKGNDSISYQPEVEEEEAGGGAKIEEENSKEKRKRKKRDVEDGGLNNYEERHDRKKKKRRSGGEN